MTGLCLGYLGKQRSAHFPKGEVMENFEAIAGQYEAMIWKVIHSLNIYKNKEEFYQIGLIALWEASRGFDPMKGSFTTYAYSYVRGRLLTELTKRRKYEDTQTATAKEEFWESIVDDKSTIPLEGECILAYCSQLTEPQKKWVLYTSLADLSIKQIAEIENVSVSAVKAWRKGARKKLIEEMKSSK